ncbi:MAG: c-type cytochrome, partial [Vicinamibacterales bacterium]
MRSRSNLLFTRIALVTFLASASLAAQATPKVATVLDGVYTSAQARRGQEQFEQQCVSCHRQDLGGVSGPALKGDRFLDQWREFPLAVLLNDIASQMPLRSPGGLPRTAYVDIAAYLMEANAIPAGTSELTEDLAAGVLFVGPGGPRPLP